MEGALRLWAFILAVGALNYASRLSFIAFFARRSIPPLLARALRYVPAAMLSALIVPMIFLPAPAAGAFNPKVVAALAAGAVAWTTRSTLKTMSAGMATLWLLQWLVASIGP
jgi:branched-subunit amino acid transport protein